MTPPHPAPASRVETPDASPGFLLWRATLAWQRRVRAALDPHGLTHVQFVLLTTSWWIEEHEGPPTQAVLAERAGTDTMMTSQVARRLEADGLLRREPDPGDARARRLHLTAAGRAKLAAALPAVEAVDAEAFSAVPTADRPALLRALATLGG
ncbi:Transcriptional regulator MarR family [Patulibacter medicamentivorans]|uniref:Transcriptional regulator MarR family n=1 Tax=Patulibacter medicamentivorans TaxID=1097667 RepID=H0E0T4_9ACTN|nr:MarR family winged helix-turn-helix transcriptional regulator [Patulibacter medicamentivorans]EHN12698.1 Transcriptional regulator MarR family [Patulibacter medicamentivorans]